MKVPCKKKQQWVQTKGTCEKKSHRLPHTQTVTEERVPRCLIYCNCNFGICIEISLLIFFIVKKQKAIIHRNGRKNRKLDRFNWEAWNKYVFNNMSLFTKSSDKEKEKNKQKGIVIEQRKVRKGRWRFRFRMIKEPKICCKILQQLHNIFLFFLLPIFNP